MSQLVENKWTHKLIKINELTREFDNNDYQGQTTHKAKFSC